ncbi:MAG: lysophospholipid acyltransferase family protein [Nitrospinota bacterium]
MTKLLTKLNSNKEDQFRLGLLRKLFMFVVRMAALPVCWTYFRLLNKIKIIGEENLPVDQKMLVCANHQSWVDTVIMPYSSAKRMTLRPYMIPAKEGLFSIPVLGFLIRYLGAFPVKRGRSDTKTISKLIYFCKQLFVIAFPEGTRSKTGKLLRGKSTVGSIIYSAKPCVIPALLINTEHYPFGYEKKWFNINYCVVYGQALELSKFYAMEPNKETFQLISNEIMLAIGNLKQEHINLYITKQS